MNDIDDLHEFEEFDKIFFNLEEEHVKETPHKPAVPEIIEEPLNKIGLTESEYEIVCLLFCGTLFVLLISGSLIGYMLYYFSL